MQAIRCNICGETYLGNETPSECPYCGAHKQYLVSVKDWEQLWGEEPDDVSKKHLEKALNLEVSNVKFYKAVSKKSQNKEISAIFKRLSKVEAEHAEVIAKLLKIEEPEIIFDAQAFDSDKENIEESKRRETSASEFYANALKETTQEFVKKFFTALVEIEKDHLELDNKLLEN